MKRDRGDSLQTDLTMQTGATLQEVKFLKEILEMILEEFKKR